METSRNEQKQPLTSNAKERINCCKFYKGGDANPYEGKDQDKSMFWCYEMFWCGMSEQESTEQVREYAAYGLSDFNKDDGTPISLKALLFNRYCHWCGGYGNDAEGFKAWYIKTYCNLKTQEL